MTRFVAPLTLSCTLFVMGCGAPFTSVDDSPADAPIAADGGQALPIPTGTTRRAIVPPPPVGDAGARIDDDDAALDGAPDAAALLIGDAAIDATSIAVHDAAPEAAVIDAQAPPMAALCCVGTVGNGLNVHCAAGVTASCDTSDAGASARYSTTTFNSAQCSPQIGSSCLSWPESSGSPQACATNESCCTGIVQACP